MINQITHCKRSRILVVNPSKIFLKLQDVVILGMPHNVFLKASAWVYLMPLLALMAAACAASLIGWSEGSVIVTSLLGLALGFLLLRWYSKRASQGQAFQPVILRKIDNIEEKERRPLI
jgi:sigma-E factor negative regulatory protein RseC